MDRDRDRQHWRRITFVAVLVVSVVAVPASAARAQPPDQPADVASSAETCELPNNWSELTSAGRLGCTVRGVGTFIAWVGALLLIAYMVAAIMLRPVPLSARSGTLGTFRRARERLPLVGRAYRPRIELRVTDAKGDSGPVARSIHELLIAEMGPASDEAWFRERLTGAGFNADLSNALESARPGLGAVGKFLTGLLPQERVGIRIQLHDPTPITVSMTAELLDRSDRSVASRVFWAPRLSIDDELVVTDHYLLVRPVAAWLAFQLYEIWPGEADKRPNPVNTENAESFGEFRRGELLETIDQIGLARSAYHQAISLDGDNVGALVNLALLDSRDRDRIGWCKVRLNDARVLVDGIRSDVQRAELRVRINHVQAVASLNRLMWEENDVDDAGRFALLAEATGSVQNLARTLRGFASSRRRDTHRRREDPERSGVANIGKSYEYRAVALGACIAVEHQRLGVTVRSVEPPDVRGAIDRMAGGALLSFQDCFGVLDKPGKPISTAATYLLACALARRRDAPDSGGIAVASRDATSYLREALAGDPALRRWALPVEGELRIEGDPAFAAIREDARWTALEQEFCPRPPASQVAALATKT